MATTQTRDHEPDLREFIKANEARLNSFCFYMAPSGVDTDEIVLGSFREMGDRFRKRSRKTGTAWEEMESRLELFRIAWQRVADAAITLQFTASAGRDMRPLKAMDEDLIAAWGKDKRQWERHAPEAADRLSRVDADFRAPVVLRDVLGFDDEEAMRILGLRWGVYRHRLHRGRIEFTHGMRGQQSTELESTTH